MTAPARICRRPSRDAAVRCQFFREVRREMSKVTWPTWKETYLTTIMVFIMVGTHHDVLLRSSTALLAYGERLLIGASG